MTEHSARIAHQLAELERQHTGSGAFLGCDRCILVVEIQRLRREVAELIGQLEPERDP